MNIQLNATLIVQIIHFLIAYMLVRFLVFKPAMLLIDAQEHNRAHKRDLISYNYVLIDREKNAAHDQWQQGRTEYERCQERLTVRPDLLFSQDIYPEHERISTRPLLPSSETTQLLIKNATHELITRVKKV